MANKTQTTDKESVKKSTVALLFLSFTVILLLCLIGYNTLKENWSPSIYAEKKVKAKRPLRIISDNGDPQRFSPANRRAQKNYTSGQNSYPAKQNIPEIEKSIIANEFLHNKANSTIRTLEKDLELAQKKIESFDYALDTLTNKIELTRAEKDKLESQYQEQFTQIQNQNNLEKEELQNSLQESISNQFVLKKSIEEKIAKINELTEQLAEQKTGLENQTNEIQALTKKIEAHQNATDYEKAQNAYLRSELIKAQQHNKEAHTDLAEFEAELDDAIKQERELKESVNQLSTSIAMKDFEIGALIDSFTDVKKEMNIELQDMVFFINWEKSHAEKLHHELQMALEKHNAERELVKQLEEKLNSALKQAEATEQNFAAANNNASAKDQQIQSLLSNLEEVKSLTTQKVATLSELFETEHLVLEATLKSLNKEKSRTEFLHEKLKQARTRSSEMEAELAEQSIYFNKKEADLNERMHELKIAFLHEKIQVEELSEHIKNITATHNDERKKTLELEEALVVTMEKSVKLEEELTFERSLLAAKENEIVSQRQATEVEKNLAEDSLATLRETQEVVAEKQNQISNLEAKLGEEREKMAFLENQLGNQMAHMTQKEKEYEATIKDLSANLENQKMRTLDLYTSLEDTLKKYSTDSHQVAELEKQLVEKDNKVAAFETELAELRKLFTEKETELLTSIEDLKLALNTEEARAMDFSDALLEATAMQLAEEQKALELEERLQAVSEKSRRLESALQEQQQIIAQKEQELVEKNDFVSPEKVKELETKLNTALSQVKSFEEELAEKKQHLISKEEELEKNQLQMAETLKSEQKKSNELEEQLKLALSKTQNLENELKEQRHILTQKEQEKQEMELGSADLLQKDKEQIEELEKKLNSSVENTQALEVKLKNQQTLILQKEEEIQASRLESQELLLHEKARVSELESQLCSLQEKRTHLEEQLSDQIAATALKEQELQNELEKQKSLVTAKEEALAESEKKSSNLADALTAQIALVSEMEQEITHVTNQALDIEKERIVELEAALSEQKKVVALQSDAEATAKQHALDLATKLDALQSETEALVAAKEQSNHLRFQAEMKYQDLEEKYATVAAKADLFEADLEELHTQHTTKEKEILTQLQTASEILLKEQEKALELEQALTELNEKRSDSLDQNQQLQTRLNEGMATLENERATREQLESKLSETLEYVTVLETSLASKEQELALHFQQEKILATQWDAHLKEAEADLIQQYESKLEKERQELNAALEQLSQEKSYATALFDTLQETLSKIDAEQSYTEELETRLKEFAAQITHTESQLATMYQKESEMQQKIDQYASQTF